MAHLRWTRRVVSWRRVGKNRFMARLDCGHSQETHTERVDGPVRVDRCWVCESEERPKLGANTSASNSHHNAGGSTSVGHLAAGRGYTQGAAQVVSAPEI